MYRTFYKVSASYVQQNNGSEQDAEDVFQEVLVSFMELVKEQKIPGRLQRIHLSVYAYTLTVG